MPELNYPLFVMGSIFCKDSVLFSTKDLFSCPRETKSSMKLLALQGGVQSPEKHRTRFYLPVEVLL